MTTVTDAMERLAALIATGTDRPVVTDPRNVVPPCVLVEPPELEPDGTMCGTHRFRHIVRAIGLPGARAELEPLALLVDEVLTVLDDGPGWTGASFDAYTPLADSAAQEPSMAYRITAEEYR